jgi:DNA-binding beta-propeller fold protein YncE
MHRNLPRFSIARALTRSLLLAIALGFLASPPGAAPGPAEAARKTQPRLVWPEPPAPARIEFVQTFSSARDFGWKRSLWRRIVDWVKNETDPSILRRPFAVTVDADGRLIIADTAARDVKIFDPKTKSVSVIRGYRGRHFGVPVSVATDDARNIYVADSGAGRVLKFSPQGKFLDFIGGEEGAFQRPASIAFNPANKLLYVVDTTRPRIFAFAADGRPMLRFGERGDGPAQFNFPTFIAADRSGRLFVNDTLNFRVQVLSPEGKFLYQFGQAGDGSGNLNRPKGLALDSEGHVYLAEAIFSTVQVFDGEGRFLVHFGREGTGAGEFYIPAGLAIDRADRIYVADPYRRRVQVFQYRPASGERASSAPSQRKTSEESNLQAHERFASGGAW